ncbi:hypothetical protein PMIN04_011954 [Paraphaeosphaeria minitans]
MHGGRHEDEQARCRHDTGTKRSIHGGRHLSTCSEKMVGKPGQPCYLSWTVLHLQVGAVECCHSGLFAKGSQEVDVWDWPGFCLTVVVRLVPGCRTMQYEGLLEGFSSMYTYLPSVVLSYIATRSAIRRAMLSEEVGHDDGGRRSTADTMMVGGVQRRTMMVGGVQRRGYVWA